MERVFNILQRIQQLWKELEQAKQKTREYEALMEQFASFRQSIRFLLTRLRILEIQNE
jgi:hypothetical protein